MPLTTLTLEDLYLEVSELARDQGIGDKESWDEMVEDVIEDHLDLGELDLEQDTEGMKELLRARWETFKKESAVIGAEEDEVLKETDVLVEPKDEEEDEDDLKSEEEDY